MALNVHFVFVSSVQMECTEDAVPTAVYIHNALNEQAWKEIMEYEEFHKEYVQGMRAWVCNN